MKTSHLIKLETYSCQLTFIVTDKLKEESKRIYKLFKVSIEEDEGESEGIFISPDIDKYYLIIDIKYLTHNTLAHEVYHAVVGITEDRGVVDEEAQAWLAGHLTGAIYKFLNKKKLVVNNG